MQEQRKKGRNFFTIIVVASIVVVFVGFMVFWRNYEARHKEELRSFVVATQPVTGPIESSDDSVTTPEVKTELPKDPEVLLAMAEEALKDEGYFEAKGTTGKGSHVYYLLKKALECSCDVQKAGVLCQNLKERSAKSNYGAWFVSSDLFAELDEKIKGAKES